MVLSGYLITRSLEKMRGQVTGAGLLSFHTKRLTRLVPALYIMLALGWLAGLEEFRDNILWHAGFLTNVHMALTGEWVGFLSHLWSLATQEQF
jgi:peptidoglycan/LPS O-acetylase OafA/YrhL